MLQALGQHVVHPSAVRPISAVFSVFCVIAARVSRIPRTRRLITWMSMTSSVSSPATASTTTNPRMRAIHQAVISASGMATLPVSRGRDAARRR